MDNQTQTHPEKLPIRPPSEWRSLLIRVTRGCRWNRCRFCGIYPHLGVAEFSTRTTEEIKKDIHCLHQRRPGADTAFLGDSDPLQAGISQFIEITRYIHSLFNLKRLTCYARSSTLNRLGQKNIIKLGQAGLTRIHIGLESGDANVLRFQRKGQSPEMIKRVAIWLRNAGIEISFYILLGLGGADQWRKHITLTAKLMNETRPDFIRLRRLWLYGNDNRHEGLESPLLRYVRNKTFTPQTPEGTVLELQLLLKLLDPMDCFLACDHNNNYLHVNGNLKDDLADMLAEIDSFLGQPEDVRQAHYLAIESGI